MFPLQASMCATGAETEIRPTNPVVKTSNSTETMVRGLCLFQDSWLRDPAFKDWIERDGNNVRNARCKICKKTIDIASMGRTAVKFHGNGKKHQELVERFARPQEESLRRFLSTPASATASITDNETRTDRDW